MSKFLSAFGLTIVSSLCMPPALHAQISEDFSDGDFIQQPAWDGTLADFSVSDEQLRLLAPPQSGDAYLTTPSRSIRQAVWEFKISLEFNPSDANFARVYLVSDQSDLGSPLNGYYVQIGGKADEISLYRQGVGGHTKIIDGEDGRVDLSTCEVKIRTTRDENGNWELFSDVGLTGNYKLEGVTADATFPSSAFFGVYCVFTSTRSDKFFFDDITVTGDPFTSPYAEPSYKDVVINEIFADPTPAQNLPEVEFVELYNRSANAFDLSDWTLFDPVSAARLPATILLPGAYIVLTKAASDESFPSITNVIGVSSFPSLNNDGDIIVLKSPVGVTVDSVNYDETWYRSAMKSKGGWTLELIDPENPCGEEDNWTASQDLSGGTPGAENSVRANKPDRTGPSVVRAVAISSNQVRLFFNEKLANEEIGEGNIYFDPPIPIGSVSFSDYSLRSLDVQLKEDPQYRKLYSITVDGIRDCNGNAVNEKGNSVSFALPEKADSLDVVINEILFNPLPGGSDFVELYNRSAKFINLKNWRIGDYTGGEVQMDRIITDKDLMLTPGAYLVLTPDADAVIGQYPLAIMENFYATSLPSLPDNEGSVSIANSDGSIIDALEYSENLHSAFLKDNEGVSLERVSANAGTMDAENWSSASSSSGFATPGRINSNARADARLPNDAISVDPPIFQPLYGQPNFTQIHYKFDHGGYVANAKIFDAQGRAIKVLANNELLGSEGFYRWDGDRDDGSKARVGYYWLWFEVFSQSGDIQTFHERVIIAGEF
jgi:Lamin Tail Domain